MERFQLEKPSWIPRAPTTGGFVCRGWRLPGPSTAGSRHRRWSGWRIPLALAVAGVLAACGSKPVPVIEDWCLRVAGGPAGRQSLTLDLSRAHALVRSFAAAHPRESEVHRADAALTAALATPGVWGQEVVQAYAAALPSVCAVEAGVAALGPVRVEQLGRVALVHPGTGPVVLPPGTEAVAVDLRGLPQVEGLREALAAAVAPALAAPVPGAVRRVPRHFGLTDEVLSEGNVYQGSLRAKEEPALAAAGTRELPLALVTGERMAPDAAALAGHLRLMRRAWLVGEPVVARVAEAHWVGVGTGGLAVHVGELSTEGVRWRDVIPADAGPEEEERFVRGLAEQGRPEPVPEAKPTRPPAVVHGRFGAVQPAGAGVGEARAALLTAHGALRLFFPYLPSVETELDARLSSLLAASEAAPGDRTEVVDRLRQLAATLQDGHAVARDAWAPAAAGVLPVVFEHLEGRLWVRRSGVPELRAGDTLVALDGQPAEDWLAAELARTSASTPGHAQVRAANGLRSMAGPRQLGVRGADGQLRSVTVEPQPAKALSTLGRAPSARPSGWLTDLGAPELYFLNLDRDVLRTPEAFQAAIQEARGGAGLVLDMRGYPGIDHFEMARALVARSTRSPRYRVPVLSGPAERTVSEQQHSVEPLPPELRFDGRVVLLVGPGTVSAAENFALLLRAGRSLTVVGRQSAGTNGNVTGLQLPGGFVLFFTGMEVLTSTGERFHGVGVLPDVEVQPTPEALAAGRDPELERAVELLQAAR